MRTGCPRIVKCIADETIREAFFSTIFPVPAAPASGRSVITRIKNLISLSEFQGYFSFQVFSGRQRWPSIMQIGMMDGAFPTKRGL
jgi:hypothetical protein